MSRGLLKTDCCAGSITSWTCCFAAFPPTEPGQFIQLNCRDSAEDAGQVCVEHEWEEARWPSITEADLIGREAFLRRPFSLAGRFDRDDGVVLRVIHRVVGVGTDWLSNLTVGEPVDLIGPLGNRFPMPANGSAILVGGGVGIPPMLYLAQHWSSMHLIAFCGVTTLPLLPLTVTDQSDDSIIPSERIAEFAEFNVPSIVATDDGSFGFHGLVTAALDRYLTSMPAGPSPTLYTCGPEPMMKRVAAIAVERGLHCFVAVERAMACGMGTCQSCVIRLRNDEQWRYALSCTEGPIFAASDLLW